MNRNSFIFYSSPHNLLFGCDFVMLLAHAVSYEMNKLFLFLTVLFYVGIPEIKSLPIIITMNN
jgi:hypothetical protein